MHGRRAGGNWTLLHAAESVRFDQPGQTKRFRVSSRGKIAELQFNFTAVANATDADAIAIAELAIQGMPPPLPPQPACKQIGSCEVCACCSIDASSFKAKEGPLGIVDGNALSKWHTQWEPSPFHSMYPWLSLHFNEPVTITGYNMTAANDFENRDPSAW